MDEKETEFRIQNTPAVKSGVTSTERIFLLPIATQKVSLAVGTLLFERLQIGGFKPPLDIQSHRIHSGFWLLNSEFFFGKFLLSSE
ncbi:hypothetical protein A6V25_08340 [Nostoc sp. ATCC 53789]|nr:hypothetical protein A6V25_08340 [Nostoc sp. ATCC 53789]